MFPWIGQFGIQELHLNKIQSPYPKDAQCQISISWKGSSKPNGLIKSKE